MAWWRPAAQALDLLSGKNTLRVAYAGPDKARVSVLDEMAERVFVTDGKTAWAYDSHRREAHRFAVPQGRTTTEHRAAAGMPDPQTLAKRFLDAVDPTTEVSVTGNRVGGRPGRLPAAP